MNNVQSLTQTAVLDNKRNISFWCTLSTSYHVYTISTQRIEQLTGNTRRMLHVFANDSNRSQTTFCRNRRDFTSIYLTCKLFFKHSYCQICITMLNGKRSIMLGRGLWNKEHAHAILRQRIKDTGIDANHTNHTQSGNRNQTRIVDGRNTLNGFPVFFRHIICYPCARGFRIEGIFDNNRNILMEHRIYSRRINHLRAKVTQLHCFQERQMVNHIGITDNPRVCSHKPVHIRPYFQAIRIQCRSYDRSGIIWTATSQISHFTTVLISRNKSGNQCHFR